MAGSEVTDLEVYVAELHRSVSHDLTMNPGQF